MEKQDKMSELSEYELKSFLGRKTADAYGRNLGKIIGISLNSYGEMEAVELEKGNGELERVPIDHLIMNRGEITVLPKWKIEVESLLKEINSGQRRLDALTKLLESHEVPKNLYEELRQKQEKELADLKAKKDLTVSILQNRSKELEKQIEDLTKLLIEIKAGNWSSDFSNKAYGIASNSIEPNLDFTAKEKKELTDCLVRLTKLL